MKSALTHPAEVEPIPTPKLPAPVDPRLILAAEIIKGWSLGEISEHGGSGTTLSVVNIAMELAERFYEEARKRGWHAD